MHWSYIFLALTHRYNTLRLSDTIWWHISGLTLAQVVDCCLTALSHYLAQVMACCLMVLSHYPNQCWLLAGEVLWYSHQMKFTASTQDTLLYNEFRNYIFEIIATSPRAQSVNSSPPNAAYMRQRFGSTLVQLMACCLFDAKSCWVIINWTLRNKIQWNFN